MEPVLLSILWLALGLVALFLFAFAGVKLYFSIQPEEGQPWFPAIRKNKWKLGFYVICVCTAVALAQTRPAYQMKTSINQRNHTVERKLEALDETKVNIPPAQGDARDKSFSGGAEERNREENRASVRAFLELESDDE